uniref:Drf_GBD domain-containing protein n=1 Tax=Globodera pallida TaxID=36090 RepID=A0A183CEY1_GLOPA
MTDGMARPVSRSRSAGRFGRQQQQQPELSHQNFEAHSDLNVRVKERDPTTAVEERPRSRLMNAIFKGVGGGDATSSSEQKTNELKETLKRPLSKRDPTTAVEERPRSRLMNAIFKGVGGGDATSSSEQKTNELKETLKRPLSSLFRRSHLDRNPPPAAAAAATQQSSTAPFPLSPQQPPPPPRLAPTARSPIVVNSQQQQQKSAIGSNRTTQQAEIARSSGIANGNSSTASSAAVSTTAIRPFSGFPGRRPPLAVQTESTYGQSMDNEPTITTGGIFDTDLSEQAATAPHVSLRRLSGLVYGADHSFVRRDGAGLRGSSGKVGGEIDVNFLSRFLCPEDETSDERIPWNWDSLFASVSSELREEWALEEEANNNEMAPGGPMGELGTMPNGLSQQGRKP